MAHLSAAGSRRRPRKRTRGVRLATHVMYVEKPAGCSVPAQWQSFRPDRATEWASIDLSTGRKVMRKPTTLLTALVLAAGLSASANAQSPFGSPHILEGG